MTRSARTRACRVRTPANTSLRSHERRAIPAGNVFGGRNRCRLTRLSKWNWIRQAKTVNTLEFGYPSMSVVPVFIRSLALVAIRADSGAGLTPLESFLLRIGTGPSPHLKEIGRTR